MVFENLYNLLRLYRFKVSLAVSFTAISGYVIFNGNFDIITFFTCIGVFILASGASAMNQYQERHFDARMTRTSTRPIPAGKIKSGSAFYISLITIVVGLIILYASSGFLPAILGLLNLAWYNLLYTNLKKYTPFAVIPGSLTGAIPLFIGWSAAGGVLYDTKIIFLGLFLFIWQIPHFWLLLLKYAKEYEQAGFPSIHKAISKDSLRIVIFSWIVATAMLTMAFPFFGLFTSKGVFVSIFVLNVSLIAIFTWYAFIKKQAESRLAFASINIYMIVLLAIIAGSSFL